MDDLPRWLLFATLLLLACFYRCGLIAYELQADAHLVSLGDQRKKDKITVLRVSYLASQWVCLWYGYTLLSPLLQRLPALFALLLWFFALSLLVAITTLLPHPLVASNPAGFLRRTQAIRTLLTAVFVPLALTATLLHEAISRLLRLKPPPATEQVTQEQLRTLVDVSEESGFIEEQERTMIHNIFDFDEIEVASLMTHRTDIIGVGVSDTVQDLVRLALAHGFSRLPVYDGDLDHIKGILFVKDFLCFVGAKGASGRSLTDFIRPAVFVPQTQKCTDLLGLLKEHKTHVAIVVDDYGGTAGLISMEDLLEAIVGNIQDEYDEEQEFITPLEDDLFLLDGATPLEQLESLFDCTFSVDPDTTTLSGLVTSALGRIPVAGETPHITIEEIPFEVVAVADNRIAKLRVDLRGHRHGTHPDAPSASRPNIGSPQKP